MMRNDERSFAVWSFFVGNCFFWCWEDGQKTIMRRSLYRKDGVNMIRHV